MTVSATLETPSASPLSRIPVLRTDRLMLRGLERADYDVVEAFYATSRSSGAGGPLTGAACWSAFATLAGHWPLMGFGWWMVTEDGKPRGLVGLHHPAHKAERELGWLLFDGAEGRGLAQEAAVAARGWGAANLPSAPLVSYILRGNTRSEALATRLGARPDGPAPHNSDADTWRHPVTA